MVEPVICRNRGNRRGNYFPFPPGLKKNFPGLGAELEKERRRGGPANRRAPGRYRQGSESKGAGWNGKIRIGGLAGGGG